MYGVDPRKISWLLRLSANRDLCTNKTNNKISSCAVACPPCAVQHQQNQICMSGWGSVWAILSSWHFLCYTHKLNQGHTDAHSMARCYHSYIYLYLLLYLYIMSSPVQNWCHWSSFVSFILITCLFNLLPLLFMLLVILSLLMWSCLYSQHNWRKCCCLDRTDTSIVNNQSPLKTSLLRDDFSSMKRKRRKRMGFWRKGWMNCPSFKVIR